MTKIAIERLRWEDPFISDLPLPTGTMKLRYGFGSGLATRPGDPPGTVWAIGDRGPNIKVKSAMSRYGLEHLEALASTKGAKVMPRSDIGPTLAELRIHDDAVLLARMLPLLQSDGRAVSGLANPDSDSLLSEPVFDLAGRAIPRDVDGLDTEGIVALSNGGFWVGDEFGPSLVRLDAMGKVLQRMLPRPADADYAGGQPGLPAIAARRQLNRGFEALAMSDDERWLFLAFQSPLAHPDEAAHRQARHVRIWRLDAATGNVVAQYAYPLDEPETFERDCALGSFERSDIKVSELLWSGADTLLVLERGSATTKIYRCSLASELMLAPEHLSSDHRPTLEQMSAAGGSTLPQLSKEIVFTSDDFPQVGADIEGMARMSANELLLVSDNDFGVEGAATGFWRLRFEFPL